MTSREKVRELFNQLSMIAMEIENLTLDAGDKTGVLYSETEEMERYFRDLRYIANALAVVEEREESLNPEDIDDQGVKLSIGPDFLEIEMPYELVTKSTRFRLLSKKHPLISGFSSINREWRKILWKLLKDKNYFPFEHPLKVANIDVTVLFPTKRQRDADHFWFRPILDSLVSNRLLLEDYSTNVNISFFYRVDRENPGVIVQIREGTEADHPEVRGKMLRSVSDIKNARFESEK